MVDPIAYGKVLAALRRQKANARRDVETKTLAELGLRTKVVANVGSVNDVARVVADALAEQRAEILEHVSRLIKLLGLQHDKADQRGKNLHQRLCAIESALRRKGMLS